MIEYTHLRRLCGRDARQPERHPPRARRRRPAAHGRHRRPPPGDDHAPGRARRARQAGSPFRARRSSELRKVLESGDEPVSIDVQAAWRTRARGRGARCRCVWSRASFPTTTRSSRRSRSASPSVDARSPARRAAPRVGRLQRAHARREAPARRPAPRAQRRSIPDVGEAARGDRHRVRRRAGQHRLQRALPDGRAGACCPPTSASRSASTTR